MLNATYDCMELAEKIKRLRKRVGLSQSELAERAEVSQTLVSAWERGSNVPKLPELRSLANAFGVTADYLVHDDDDRQPEELDAELRVREMATRLGWQAVYDRVLMVPAQAVEITDQTVVDRRPPQPRRQARGA